MNVLMTTDTVGGVWGYAVQLARAVAPAGVAVTLAAVGRTSAGQRAEAAGLPLVEADFKLEWMDDPWADVAASGAWLLGLERQLRPDVVHLNGYAHGRLPFAAPTVVVGHSCVGSWWQAVHGEPAPAGPVPRRGDRRPARGHGRRRADPGHAGRTGPPVRPTPDADVIHNGRDADDFRPATKQPFVLAAGRLWDEAKNLATLRRAAAGLPWPVRVAGDGGAGGGRRTARPARRGGHGRGSSPPPRSTACRPGTSRSGCRSWRRPWPGARWCSATSRRCGSCGTGPPCSSRRPTPTPCTPRCGG